jgi:hypothetical protein
MTHLYVAHSQPPAPALLSQILGPRTIRSSSSSKAGVAGTHFLFCLFATSNDPQPSPFPSSFVVALGCFISSRPIRTRNRISGYDQVFEGRSRPRNGEAEKREKDYEVLLLLPPAYPSPHPCSLSIFPVFPTEFPFSNWTDHPQPLPPLPPRILQLHQATGPAAVVDSWELAVCLRLWYLWILELLLLYRRQCPGQLLLGLQAQQLTH